MIPDIHHVFPYVWGMIPDIIDVFPYMWGMIPCVPLCVGGDPRHTWCVPHCGGWPQLFSPPAQKLLSVFFDAGWHCTLEHAASSCHIHPKCNNCYNHVTHYHNIAQSHLSLPPSWFDPSQSHDSSHAHPWAHTYPDPDMLCSILVVHSTKHVFPLMCIASHTELCLCLYFTYLVFSPLRTYAPCFPLAICYPPYDLCSLSPSHPD